MLQGGRHKFVTILLYHDCIGLVGTTLHATNLIVSTRLLQIVITACSKLVDNLGQAVRTQLVDGLLADLLQDVRFLRVYSGFVKSANKPSTSCVRTACPKLSTSMEQAVNNL